MQLTYSPALSLQLAVPVQAPLPLPSLSVKVSVEWSGKLTGFWVQQLGFKFLPYHQLTCVTLGKLINL